MYAVGSEAALNAAVPALKKAAARVGLSLVPEKCQAFGMPTGSATSSAAAAVAQHLHIQHAKEGFVACGTPIGTNSFIMRHVQAKVDEVKGLVDKLCELPDPLTVQDKFAVLYHSLQHKLAHLPRTVPWRLLEDAFTSFTAHLSAAALALFDMPPMTTPHRADPIFHQLTLPLRHGGFGLHHHDVDTAGAAWLAGAAMSDAALQDGPPAFRRLVGTTLPASPHIAQWDSLLERFPSLCPPAERSVTHENLRHLIAAQSGVHRLSSERRSAALLSLLPRREDQARLHSASSSPGSAWLEAVPYVPQLRIPDHAFRTSAQLRLGVTGLSVQAPAAPCSVCHLRVRGNDMLHAMTCSTFSSTWTRRHDLIVDALRRIGRRAGCASSVEPRYDALGSTSGSRERGDISTLLTPGPGRVAVDVSVVCPTAKSYISHAQQPGGAAAERDRVKLRGFQRHGESGLAFRPFGVEVFGYLGSHAMRYLRELADAAASSGRVPRSRFLAGAFQELSVAVCLGNGMIVRAGLNAYVRAAGQGYMPGLEVPTADLM